MELRAYWHCFTLPSMPRATIWIRKEDWPAWEAIQDKPEWLHERLTATEVRTAANLDVKPSNFFEDGKELAEHVFGCSHAEFKNGHCNKRTCPNFWRNYG